MAKPKPRIAKAIWQLDNKPIWICTSVQYHPRSSKAEPFSTKQGIGHTPVEAYKNWQISPVQMGL